MPAVRQADDTIIRIHAMHIAKIPKLADRRKALAVFEDTYGGGATAKLKQQIERLWPLRNAGAAK